MLAANESLLTDILKEEPFLELSPLEKALKTAEDLINEAKRLYSEQKLDAAYRILGKHKDLENGLSAGEKERLRELLKTEEKLFQSIDEDYAYCQEILRELNTEEGWNVEKEKGTHKIS